MAAKRYSVKFIGNSKHGQTRFFTEVKATSIQDATVKAQHDWDTFFARHIDTNGIEWKIDSVKESIPPLNARFI